MYWSLRIYENFDSRPPINAPKKRFWHHEFVGMDVLGSVNW
jgi:hypothetical protein